MQEREKEHHSLAITLDSRLLIFIVPFFNIFFRVLTAYTYISNKQLSKEKGCSTST
jgi:hypothetical protein